MKAPPNPPPRAPSSWIVKAEARQRLAGSSRIKATRARSRQVVQGEPTIGGLVVQVQPNSDVSGDPTRKSIQAPLIRLFYFTASTASSGAPVKRPSTFLNPA